MTTMNDRLDEYHRRRKHPDEKRVKQARRLAEAKTATRTLKISRRSCRMCTNSSVEWHHIVPRGKFAKYDPSMHHPDNAMPLCHYHHQAHHTTMNRVPRNQLTSKEETFAIAKMGKGWFDKWYPEGHADG